MYTFKIIGVEDRGDHNLVLVRFEDSATPQNAFVKDYQVLQAGDFRWTIESELKRFNAIAAATTQSTFGPFTLNQSYTQTELAGL